MGSEVVSLKIDKSNCQIMEVKDGYAIKISMPDNSGNYIHSQPERLNVAMSGVA